MKEAVVTWTATPNKHLSASQLSYLAVTAFMTDIIIVCTHINFMQAFYV